MIYFVFLLCPPKFISLFLVVIMYCLLLLLCGQDYLMSIVKNLVYHFQHFCYQNIMRLI
ncbi:hypothetical protein CsatB_022610 [Cannabis sativa]